MISSATSRVAYTLSSTTETLAVPFYFLESSHLKVIKTVSGVETTLTLGTHYSVSGAGVMAGGSITMTGTGVATGNTITIKRSVPFTQLVDYVANSAFPADSHEKALDKLTMLCQFLNDMGGRSLRFEDGETLDGTLTLADRKGKGLSFDATTGEVEFYDVQDVLDAADAAAASAAAAAASSEQAEVFAGNVNSLGRGVTVAFFTDSIGNYGEGYPYYAQAFAQGGIWLSSIKFNPGFTSEALLDAVSQITSLSPLPHVVVLQCGTNDALANVSVATFAANFDAICAAIEAVGCRVMLSTVPPLTGTYNQRARAYSNYIKRKAAMGRYPIIPLYESVVDPATGTWLTANDSGDGVHPSNAGNRLFGRAVADTFSDFFPGGAVNILADANTGGLNLVSNGWLLTDSNADGIADGWSITPGSGISYSLVQDSRGWKWQRLTLAAAGGVKQFIGTAVNIGANMAVGDVMFIGCRFRTGQSGASAKITVQFTFYTSGYVVVQNFILTSDIGMTQQMADGTVFREVTVPAGCDLLLMSVQGGSADGTYDFALPTIINLTKNSLV